MKKEIFKKIILIIGVIILLIALNIGIKIIKGYHIFGNEYCEGHPYMSLQPSIETSESCSICDFFVDKENRSICEKCATITRRCKDCKKIKSKELIEEEKIKKELYPEAINVDLKREKMAYIPETDYIAFLTINKDSDKLVYPNKIEIKNMEKDSVINTIKLEKDYTLDYETDFSYIGEVLDDTKSFEDVAESFIGKREQEKIKEYNYVTQGRFFYNNGYLILMNPLKEKSFIYNLEKNEFIKDFEWNIGEYKNTKYIYIKNMVNKEEYFYFEKYDLIETSLEGLNFEKYYEDPYELVPENYYNAKIIYQNDLYVIISYYETEYGNLKLKIFDLDGKNLNLQQTLSTSNIVLSNKELIVKYNIKKEKAIWSYDIQLLNKLGETMF